MTTPHTCDRLFAGGADLERFFDLSTDLLCVAGFDGYFRLLSPSWSGLLGYSDDELTGRPFEDFVHVDDRAPTAALFAAQVEAGAVCIRFVNRYRHNDGSYRTLSWNAAPDVERGLIYAVARCLDEQIESARAIEESEALFRGAFEQSLVGMCLMSQQGRFQRVNPMLAELLGRPAEDLVGMPVAEVTHADHLKEDADTLQDLLAGRLPGLQRETRYVRPDGATVAVYLSTTLIRGQAGAPSHFVTQVLDVTGERAAAAALASTAAMLDGIVQNSQSLVYVKDLDGVYLLANRPFLKAFHVTEQELIGRDDTWLDADLASVWRVNDLRARDGAYRLHEWSGHGEERRWYESVKFPLFDGSGRLYATCGVSLDVTELHRQREEAREAEAFSAAVLAASPDAIVVHDFASGRSVYASRTAADLLTPGPDGATDADVHPDDRVRLAGALTACGDLEDDQVLQVRYRVQASTGAWRWLSRRLIAFRRGPDGRTTEVLSVIRDVSEMVAAEDQLRHAALHDPLTGLPNRTLLTDRLGGALTRAQRLGQDIAVLYCDLDGFKRVNDANGHAAGDRLLRETADRLRSVLRPQDTVARVGGDEFVLVLEADGANAPGSEAESLTLGIDVARRVVAALAEPVLIDGVEHVISTSVGLAYAGGPGSTRTAEDVLRDADAAMYRAKAAGKDRFEVFENGLRTDLAERGRVERLLRRAVQVSRPQGVRRPGSPSPTVPDWTWRTNPSTAVRRAGSRASRPSPGSPTMPVGPSRLICSSPWRRTPG